MRKRLLPATTRPIDVRKTRSISSADVTKKKEVKSKSNETRNTKDSNMTAKKVVKKTPLKSKDKIVKPKKKVEVKKVKETKKKYVKKSQVQKKESSESDNGESSSSSKEPVEVVIHVKKPQQKAQPKKTKKSGVSSGKIGKRKLKQEDSPGKTLLKNISGSSEKLETVVSTILEVAVLTKKVKPKVQTKNTVKKTTVKKKPDKKVVKKEPSSDQGETEEDQTRTKKKPVVKVKKEMKTEIKEEKEVKEEKTKKETKKDEDLKKKDKKPKKSVETKKEGEGSKDAAVASCSKQAGKKKTEKATKPKSKQDKKSEVVKSEKLVKDEVKSPKTKKTQKSPKGKTEKIEKKEKSSQDEKSEESEDEDTKMRKMKLFGFWEGPKRHREASLNALAKVHCLYENESKVMEMLDKKLPPRIEKKKDKAVKAEPESGDENNSGKEGATRRTLRTAPGIRSVGRHYDVETSSSSSPSSDESDHEKKVKKKPPQTPRALPAIKDKPEKSEDEKEKKKKDEPARKVRKRRKRCELMMDLKDMVVRKRMASLNASAMLAATYSMEKRSIRSEDTRTRTSDDSTSTDMDVESSDDEVIVSGSSKKVAVIVNQDTDVTITGLYTTRSTRHCSITGMQYRISSTSHTQTESTAVTTETVIHTTDHQSGSSVEAVGSPGAGCKSYTPLGALSSMQPPGNTSPLMRRHPCSTSAFSAPYHPHQEIHGYYQPAGPLISHHHHHSSASTSSSVPAVSGVSPSKASPGLEPPRAEGSAEEYRPPPGFPAAYPPPYSYQYIQPPPYHQDCYSPSYYHKYPNYRRYWPTPPGPPSTQMVTSETYPPQGGPLVEPFPPHPPPPPPHHSGYGVYAYSAPPPPPCYSHSPTSRGLAFIDPSFQCPCPMQSCPKNVHTGPLTGASKGSGQTAQAQNQQGNQQNVCLDSQEVSAPLPPVALTLPLETTSAHLGPPSPARGSAGMPPPASPALSTARNPQSWSPPTAHPVPIKEEDIAPKMLPTPPPEQTIVDLPITDCLQRRPHPTKRKSIDNETEVNAKKRRPATPILHELQPVRQTNTCPSDDDDIKPPVLEKQVDLHEKILDLKVVPQEKLMEKDNFLEKPLLIEQVVDPKKHQKAEKPPKKEKVEKKVLTDKKNIQAKVEKKTKKKLMPKINLVQKPVNGVKVKKDQPKTKNCKESKKACKKTTIVIKKEIEESPLVRTPTLKWSNGWSWEGEPFKAKVFLTSDEPVLRTCYPAMRHVEGDVICPRDCILLKSGTKKQQLPFVAKVTAMWENPEDGEMIVSLLWYYRPEHTEQGRQPLQPEDEIFASRHKDINSVACIEDKCYVLSYYEYCRYKMNMKMIESGITEDVRSVVPDLVGGYPRESRLPKGQISKDLLFFCRRVYDFRQKRLLKNP